MVGYLAGPKWGAIGYNIVNTCTSRAAMGVVGLMTGDMGVTSAALIWGAHIGLDRALGFGLKNEVGFGVTHLTKGPSEVKRSDDWL